MDKGIYTLLAEAQSEMPIPEAVKTGQQGNRKYKYVTLAQLLDIVRPPLNRRGIFLTQKTVVSEKGAFFIQTTVGCGDQTIVLDEEPYEYDRSPQEYGKRETYAKRYSLQKAFGLVGDEDTDGNAQGRGTQYQTNPQYAQPEKPKRPEMPPADKAELRRLTDSLVAVGLDGKAEAKAIYAEYKRGGMRAARDYASDVLAAEEQAEDQRQAEYEGMAEEDIEF